jgi:transposase
MSALARARREGEDPALSAEQEALIKRLMCEKRPERIKMEFALWGRTAVMQLIERRRGIRPSVRGMGNYLKRWGSLRKKPIKKAYEQRPEAVQKWVLRIPEHRDRSFRPR